MKVFCSWCPKEAPLLRDDGDQGRLLPGICQLHLQYMRAKLYERKEATS